MRETTNYGLKITEGNDNWKNIFDDNADNMETIDEALAAKLENVPDMVGATALTPGTAGLAPAPSAGETNRFLRADGTWTVPAGSGDSEVGIYTIDATIPVSAWQGSGPYTVTISNSSIISTMQVLEWSIVNETEATPLMLGPTEPTVSAGSLTISTTVKPVASWTVHFDLGTDGSNVLAEVAGKAGQELLGYKEEGNTASRTIAIGKFVVWKGNLYKAKVAIPQGTAFSTSNLTAVGDGGFNELQTKIGDVGSTDLQSQVTSLNSNLLYKIGDTFAFHGAQVPFRTLGDKSAIIFRFRLPKGCASNVNSFSVQITDASPTWFTGSPLGSVLAGATAGNILITGKETVQFSLPTNNTIQEAGFGVCELNATITFSA